MRRKPASKAKFLLGKCLPGPIAGAGLPGGKMRYSIPGIENPSRRVSVIQAEVHGREILGQRLKTITIGLMFPIAARPIAVDGGGMGRAMRSPPSPLPPLVKGPPFVDLEINPPPLPLAYCSAAEGRAANPSPCARPANVRAYVRDIAGSGRATRLAAD